MVNQMTRGLIEVGEREYLNDEDDDQAQHLMTMSEEDEDEDHTVLLQIQTDDHENTEGDEHLHDPLQTTAEDEDMTVKNHQ